jgi:hypothetical protein
MEIKKKLINLKILLKSIFSMDILEEQIWAELSEEDKID